MSTALEQIQGSLSSIVVATDEIAIATQAIASSHQPADPNAISASDALALADSARNIAAAVDAAKTTLQNVVTAPVPAPAS